MNVYKVMKWSTLVSGILLVLLGIVSLFTPLQSLVSLAVVLSISILISGITALVNYFTTERAERSGWSLAEGVLATLIGLWMVFGSGSGALAAIIPYVFAAFILVSGIVRVAESIELKSFGSTQWGWLLAFGILQAVLGVMLLLSPLVSAAFVTTAISLLLIGYGMSNIMVFVNMRRIGNFLRRRLGGRE